MRDAKRGPDRWTAAGLKHWAYARLPASVECMDCVAHGLQIKTGVLQDARFLDSTL